MAPRKVRLVIDTVRGLPATVAETRLAFLNKRASLPVLKLLRSAMANAEHNFHVRKEDLLIKTIVVDGGPTLKRSAPRAFGRAAPIRERTSHVSIVLSAEAPKAPVKKTVRPAKTVKKTVKKVTKSSPAPEAQPQSQPLSADSN